MARFGQAQITALLVEGGAAAVSGAVQRLAWEQGNTNMMGWLATGVAFLGGSLGAAYTSGTTSQALRSVSSGAAAIAGFVATEKLFLKDAKRIPRDRIQRAQIERARAMGVLGAGRDSVSQSASGVGQRRLLFSVTR